MPRRFGQRVAEGAAPRSGRAHLRSLAEARPFRRILHPVGRRDAGNREPLANWINERSGERLELRASCCPRCAACRCAAESPLLSGEIVLAWRRCRASRRQHRLPCPPPILRCSASRRPVSTASSSRSNILAANAALHGDGGNAAVQPALSLLGHRAGQDASSLQAIAQDYAAAFRPRPSF